MTEPSTINAVSLDELCINTIRTLTIDAVQAARSGHPGAPMGLAPAAYVLWTRHLRHDPAHPDWVDRDRFVLSCGHASMLMYSLLYLAGYDLALDEIRQFRQYGSRTPGHPEHGLTPGVETTTGPLGQGFGNAVGMAMAESHLAATFNRDGHEIVRHHTWFFASDGDLMEGVSHEAASLAGHWKLGRLIGVYDANRITIDGPTDLSYSEDVVGRFTAYGWHVVRVEDGTDLEAIDAAMSAARAELDRPSLIVLRTEIGHGSPNKQGTADSHGAPLGEEEVALTRKELDWPFDAAFQVPDEALAEWRRCRDRGAAWHGEWKVRWEGYGHAFPAEAVEFERRMEGRLPAGWDEGLPVFDPADGSLATRSASGRTLNALAARLPELVGGSADLSGSVNTILKGQSAFGVEHRDGRNVFFGVREHAMGSIMNGIALHRGARPFGGTFLIFADYMRPAIRLAAMMHQPVLYLFSHDSIGLGEDGPTHQPIETLAALRAIPGLVVIRPADANDTVEAWRLAIQATNTPVALVLTRQGVPTLDRTRFAPADGVKRGAYVLADPEDGRSPDVVLLASGSEVAVALDARETLGTEGIAARVVNMASMELFAAQDPAYRREVLPPGVTARVAVEAAHPMPWYRWVGDHGAVVGIERFGASGPYQELYEAYGITAAGVVAEARRLLGR